MRKLLVILVLVVVAMTANAQRVVTDTLQGNETVTFEAMQGASAIQALCTQLGGTSDGTLILKGSLDNVTYVTVSEKVNEFSFYPNDTLTIVNGAGWLINVASKPFLYYKVVGGGTASDTTLITIKWIK